MPPPVETPTEDTGGAATDATARAQARARFCEVLAETGNVSTAAAAAGVRRCTPYRWREAEPEFRAAWEEAEEAATDKLEAEARRRALEGTDEPVYQGGKKVGTIRRYSDRMLEILLKGRRRMYRESAKVEVSGPNGGPIPQQVTHDVSPQYAADVGRILAGLGVVVAAGGDDPAARAPQEPVVSAPPDPEAGGVPRA